MAEFEPSIAPEALPGRPNPRFPDEVSAASTGYAIGKSVEDVGSVASQVYERVQQQARQTQLTDAHNQIQALSLGLTHDPKTGAFTKEGKNAFNLVQQYLPQFDSAGQQIVDSVADPRARAAAQMALSQTRDQLAEQLDTHELSQHQKFAIDTAQSSVRLSQQTAAANYNHPDILATQRLNVDASIDNLAQQQGWSDERIKEAKAEAFSSLHSDVIDRMLTDNKVALAKVYFAHSEPELSATSAYQLKARIDEAEHKNDAEMRETVSRQLQDASAAGMRGLTIPASAMPSRGAVLAAFPKDGGERYDGMLRDIHMGADLKSLASSTPEELAAKLANYTVTSGGPGTAEALKRADYMEKVVGNILAERKKDPRLYVIQNGLGSQPLNFRDPRQLVSELRNRVATAPDVSQQLGVSTPLLTTDEAKSFASQLETMTPAIRLQALSGLVNGLQNDRAYYDVLHQVLPHSPVTAIAGAKVGQPDPAHTPVWYDSQFAASPADATTILRGEQLLNPAKGQAEGEKGGFKSGFPMPRDEGGAGLLGYFQRNANNMFASRPELGDASYTAFRSAYAALAADKGDMSGVPNRDLMQQAFKMAIGQTHDFNGRTISVPAGMDPTRFEGLADKAVGTMAVRMGAPSDWQDRMSGYQLQEVGGLGSGTYQVLNGNALVTIKGKPLTIDLSRQYSGPGAHGSPEDEERFAKRGKVSVE